MLVAFNPINADIEDHKIFHYRLYVSLNQDRIYAIISTDYIVFLNKLAEIGAYEDDEIQESQLQDSFIHPEIKYLIKLDAHTKP